MNPSPDRNKERLPPKKRESRQGSAEHHIPPDEFKPPVPFRSRHSTSRGEGGREPSDRDRAFSNPNPHLLHSPPALPASATGLHMPLPWSLNYSSPVSLPVFPGQVSDRRASGSPVWRDDPLTSSLPHHSRWLRGEGSLSLPPSPSSSSSSSFKTPFPASTREMWSYFNTGRRDYSPSLFSPSYLFSPHALYAQDPSLVEVRPRYISKRPNGLDGPGSRTASSSRPLLTGEFGNDSSRSRLEVSPYTLHANGGRRQQEDLTSPIHSAGAFLSDCQPQVSPEPHSSLQETHQSGKTSSTSLPSSPHTLGPDPRAGRGGLLDHVGTTPTEAQIYYSLGSVTHPSPHAQAYPLSSSSGTLSYCLHREPGPRLHTLGNSPNSPVLVEYPFFVRDQGWSSCSPQRTTQLYGLPCRQLSEGDVCLALTPMPTQTQRTSIRTSSRAHRTQLLPRGPAESSGSHREEMPPPPPPPPLPPQQPLSTPGPSCRQASDTPANEQQRPRKRHWSAPDTLPSTRTDKSLVDLPHGSKLMKWQ
ncbi:hypothetical protein XENOCAPTIV_010619 [Xenoophorus captivus]|uniref:AXH domain-containing protein n=1 Tax=Xenoophorus captivus TaxID=1517983 RepID=A0ABV0RH30_9TELE